MDIEAVRTRHKMYGPVAGGRTGCACDNGTFSGYPCQTIALCDEVERLERQPIAGVSRYEGRTAYEWLQYYKQSTQRVAALEEALQSLLDITEGDDRLDTKRNAVIRQAQAALKGTP